MPPEETQAVVVIAIIVVAAVVAIAAIKYRQPRDQRSKRREHQAGAPAEHSREVEKGKQAYNFILFIIIALAISAFVLPILFGWIMRLEQKG